MTDYDRDAIEFAVHKVLWNADNHPDPTAVWARDITPLRDKITDAVIAVLPLCDGLGADAMADAWDDGYLRGTLDTTSDLEPADNPWREGQNTPPGRTDGPLAAENATDVVRRGSAREKPAERRTDDREGA